MHYGDDNTYGWERGTPCATANCKGFVTFQDLDDYCMECLHEKEMRRQMNDEIYARAVRNWMKRSEEGAA